MGDFKEDSDSWDYIPFVPRSTPYTGSLENDLPYIYSAPFKEDYVQENMEYYSKQLNEKIKGEFNTEGLRPLCCTQYQGELDDFFPSGVTMGLFKDEVNGKFVMYSLFDNFLVEGRVFGGKTDYINTTTVDLRNRETRYGFIEIYRDNRERNMGNIENVLTAWVDKIGRKDFLGAEKVFETFFNDKAFRKFAPKEIWNTPLKKNPLLILTRKCLANYFNQPTVREKNPSVRF